LNINISGCTKKVSKKALPRHWRKSHLQ